MKILPLWAIVFSCTATTTFGCSGPLRCNPVDDIHSPDIIIGTANIVAVAITSSGEFDACFSYDYLGKENIRGIIPESFSVQHCFEDISVEELEEAVSSNTNTEDMNFVAGAEVVVGLFYDRTKKPEYRFAILTCMVPFHFRWDNVSDKERLELLHGLNASSTPD